MGVFEIFKSIYALKEEKNASIKEDDLEGKHEIIISKNNNGLSFKLDFPHFELLYKKNLKLFISLNTFEVEVLNFLIRKDGSNFNSRICEVPEYKTRDFNCKQDKYHSYYSKIESVFLISFLKENQRSFDIIIDKYKFNISTCKISENIEANFLCIECDNKIDFKKFKHYTNAIITSIGFLSSRFYKDEELYFQSECKDFSEITDLFYRSSKKKYSFPQPFDKYPSNWNWKLKNELDEQLEKEYSSSIDTSVFLEFVKLIIEKQRIYFSIRILFDFYNYPSISRVILMFGVLEALCEELNKKTDFIKKEIKKEKGIETLRGIENKISDEDYLVLEDVIDHLDDKLSNNTVHFEQTFKSLEINLNKEEIEVFKQRNNFFHGRIIPSRCEIDYEEDFSDLEIKYKYYSYRLYVLICKLLLKEIGFKGYLINYPKLFEDSNSMNLKESPFTKLK